MPPKWINKLGGTSRICNKLIVTYAKQAIFSFLVRVRYAVKRHNGRIRFLIFINKFFVVPLVEYLYVAIKHSCE